MTNANAGTGKLPVLVEAKEITRWLGLSRQTVNALVREGQFPQPVRVGKRRKVWVKSGLMDWLRERQSDLKSEAPAKSPSGCRSIFSRGTR
jgi:prophage regulatory protein